MGEMPVFVKLDEYKEITDVMNLAREEIQKAKAVLSRVHDLKAQEDAELEAWQNSLAEMETKLDEADKILMEPDV